MAQKFAYTHWSLSGIACSCFLRLHESFKNDCSVFISEFSKQSSPQKLNLMHQLQLKFYGTIKSRTYVITLRKFSQELPRAGVTHLLHLLTLIETIFSLEDKLKELRDFAHKWQVEHTSIVKEPSFPFHTLAEVEDNKKKIFRTLH